MTRETVLTSLTSGGTADVKVKGNTHIAGALIGTIDDHGNDLGKLDFDTGSLTFTDMRNTYKNSQTGGGISSNFITGGVKADQKNPRAGQTIAEGADGEILHANTSNFTYNNEQANTAGKTLATLGRGTIAVDGIQQEQNGELTSAGKANDSPLLSLNRDTTATEKELWKSEESQTVDATLDHRLVSAEGWSDIKKDANEIYNGVASYFSDIDPALKEQTGETGSRAYDAIRRLGISDENTNAMLSDPKLVDILNRLDNAEVTLAQDDGQASNNVPSSPSVLDQAPSVLPSGDLEEIVITGKSLEQTATEDAVVALNDLKNYIGEIRATNPKTAVALETSISIATGGAVVTAVGKGIEYGLAKSGMAEEVGKQISQVTDPIIEAGANGIERYDLSGEEFHDAVIGEGEEGNAASIKGGTGFFVGTVLGVGGAAWSIKSTTDAGIAKVDQTGASKTISAEPATATKQPRVEPSDQSVGVRAEGDFGKLPPNHAYTEIQTTSGIVIKATEGKTTTVLGTYVGDTRNIIDDQLILPKNPDYLSGNAGGFNVLNAPNEMFKTADQFWTEVNEPFLRAAVQRGDEIYMATKPVDNVLEKKLPNGKVQRSGFGREYDFLVEHGYQYDELTGKMVKN